MLKKHIDSKWHRVVSVILVACMLLTFASTVSAQEDLDWETKISADLWEAMAKSSADELIPIWLWLTDIDHSVITKTLAKEKGMDSAVYEDENRFNEEIVPEIARQLEERLGYEEAHKKVDVSNMTSQEVDALFTDDNGIMFDCSISLVDRAVSAKADEYMMAKRSITKQKYSALNDKFIKDNIETQEREIIFFSWYTPTIVVEATKSEIIAYAKMGNVDSLSLYVNYVPEPVLNIAPTQIGADGSTGTKTSYGLKGTGIVIGIIEAAKGWFDSGTSQLSGAVSANRLKLDNNLGLTLSSYPSVHATMVTSIIVGQSASYGGDPYEGIVPLATVYQTPINSMQDIIDGCQNLISYKSVNVINFSGGLNTGLGYDAFDYQMDLLIANTNVTVVISAGNLGVSGNGYVMTPAKATNAITVGNVATKSSGSTSVTPPYDVHSTSSYKSSSTFPNKPDISAPGTNISILLRTGITYIRVDGTQGSYSSQLYTDTGTSLAAPMVTGSVAQIMQAYPVAKSSFTNAKARLLIGADYSKVQSTTTSPANSTNYQMPSNLIWYKSGAGFLNAPNAVNYSNNVYTTWLFSYSSPSTSLGYISSGQKIRLVMTSSKLNTGTYSVDSIAVSILNSYGTAVASSSANYENVRIIEYTFTSSGQYTICITPQYLVDLSAGANVSVAWKIS